MSGNIKTNLFENFFVKRDSIDGYDLSETGLDLIIKLLSKGILSENFFLDEVNKDSAYLRASEPDSRSRGATYRLGHRFWTGFSNMGAQRNEDGELRSSKEINQVVEYDENINMLPWYFLDNRTCLALLNKYSPILETIEVTDVVRKLFSEMMEKPACDKAKIHFELTNRVNGARATMANATRWFEIFYILGSAFSTKPTIDSCYKDNNFKMLLMEYLYSRSIAISSGPVGMKVNGQTPLYLMKCLERTPQGPGSIKYDKETRAKEKTRGVDGISDTEMAATMLTHALVLGNNYHKCLERLNVSLEGRVAIKDGEQMAGSLKFQRSNRLEDNCEEIVVQTKILELPVAEGSTSLNVGRQPLYDGFMKFISKDVPDWWDDRLFSLEVTKFGVRASTETRLYFYSMVVGPDGRITWELPYKGQKCPNIKNVYCTSLSSRRYTPEKNEETCKVLLLEAFKAAMGMTAIVTRFCEQNKLNPSNGFHITKENVWKAIDLRLNNCISNQEFDSLWQETEYLKKNGTPTPITERNSEADQKSAKVNLDMFEMLVLIENMHMAADSGSHKPSDEANNWLSSRFRRAVSFDNLTRYDKITKRLIWAPNGAWM